MRKRFNLFLNKLVHRKFTPCRYIFLKTFSYYLILFQIFNCIMNLYMENRDYQYELLISNMRYVYIKV